MDPDQQPGSSLLDSLREIALNLRWSWNHAADNLWSQLDPELWELTRNPWVMLQTVSQQKLLALASDDAFRAKIDEVYRRKKYREQSASWFERKFTTPPFSLVAYFCMEFMLSDALPIYSGGLGNVAGDQLKAASDLGMPVVGVGLLYQVGYFRQRIDAEGRQEAVYPFNDPGQLPIRPVRQQNGEWLRIPLEPPGFRVWVRAWQVDVGRVRLYLLDTNDPANLPEHRGITSELYGGGTDLRISQEQVLGIAGWRLLRALGMRPEVCHLNEGHAAFAVLERARDYMEENHIPFEDALATTRAGNLFTTHTPVEAGFDRFAPELIERRFRHYAQNKLHIPVSDLLALGRQHPEDNSEPFSMAYLAMRGSCAVNGVSRLHGQVSRKLFQGIFPNWPEAEVPIKHVTNGVHVPIWDSAEADRLWTEACGQKRWDSDLEKVGEGIQQISDERLWELRRISRRSLIQFIRTRLSRQVAGHGATAREIEEASRIFEPDTLTLGFARRFATYKRPNLLLRDPDRLLAILTNKARPVQLVLAGKAHPQDTGGQAMIREWIEFIRHSPARSQVVFLSDYDMRMTEQLVRGVDVWLNTPRRPWEACGTSGMKVLVNGGLNLSELDGWWAEAYTPEVGWAIGDGREHGDDPAWDLAEAEQLYSILEQQVIPEFYGRNDAGVPVAWIQRVRESMARLTPAFSATRCVEEYTANYYAPLAEAYRRRSSGSGVVENLQAWKKQLSAHWSKIRFGSMHTESEGGINRIRLQVYLGELDPDAVRVELFAEASDGRDAIRHVMTRGDQLVGENAWRYDAEIDAGRTADAFTPRVVPYHPEAVIPLECSQILWYR
jgi:glycogen phosphorylase